jgi:outer membrane lipoprotein SlyB
MKQANLLLILVMLAMSAIIGGCASSKAGDVYSRDEARQVQRVRMGVVETSRAVKIEGTKTNIGTAAGTIVGGIAGSSIGGGGKTSAATTVLGAVAGGIAGAASEEGLTRKDGVEVTVRLENGQLISVVQEGTDLFQPGEKVRVLEAGGVTRVAR